MKHLPHSMLLAFALAAAAPLSADETGTEAIAIRFALEAAGQPLRCDSAPVALGSTARPTRLRDARWYAYGFALIAADGSRTPLQLEQNTWQHQDLALIDLEAGVPGQASGCNGSAATHDTVTAQVPRGEYVGLSFHIGVPGQLNHSNNVGAPPPLDLTAMAWVWQAGRRFMKVEFEPEGGVARSGSPARTWMLHLGASGCTGNPASGEIINCTAGNRFEVRLPRFDAARDVVVLDAATLLQDIDIGKDGGGAVGCMSAPSDPECGPVFARLGVGTESGAAFRAVSR